VSSLGFKVASVTVGLMASLPGASIRHYVAKHAGDAQIDLGDGGDDRAVLLLAGEVDVAYRPAEQPRRIETDAVSVSSNAKRGNGQATAVAFGRCHGARKIAPEGLAQRTVRSPNRACLRSQAT
jgi:hypothetical protein